MKQGFKNEGFLHDATVPWLSNWASVVRREVAAEAASEASEASGASGLAVHHGEIMDLCMKLPSTVMAIYQL